MAHLFVSHSSDDAGIATELVNYVEPRGHKCWYASRDVDVSDDYTSQVIRAIDQSEMLVVLISSAANESPHIRRELERAVGTTKRIVPIRIGRAIASDQLAYLLAGCQWTDLKASHDATFAGVLALVDSGPSQLEKRPLAPFHEVLSSRTSDVGVKVHHPVATIAVVCSVSMVLAPVGLLLGLLYLLTRGHSPEGRLVAGYAVFIGLISTAVLVGVIVVLVNASSP